MPWAWSLFDGEGSGVASAVAVDPDGNVVAAGSNANFAVVKLDGTTGADLWSRYIGYGTASAVAVNAWGDVVAAGAGGSNSVFRVVKLQGTNGTVLWQRDLTGGAGPANVARDVVFDASGDVVAVGSVDNPGSQEDFFVVRLSGVNGTEIWRQSIDGPVGGNDWANSVRVDSAGRIVVGGLTRNGPGSDTTGTVVKLDPADGTVLWRTDIDGTRPNGENRVLQVAVDAADDVIAGGYTTNLDTNRDAAVVKLAGGTGQELWRQTVNGSVNGDDGPASVALDGAGDVVLTCWTYNVANFAFTVAKLAGADGSLVWRQDLTGTLPGGGNNSGNAVAVDGAGDVLAVGRFQNVGTGFDFAVVKLAGPDGTELWRHNENRGDYDEGGAIAVDAAGDVVAGGLLDFSGEEAYFAFSVVKLRGSDGGDFGPGGSPSPPPWQPAAATPAPSLMQAALTHLPPREELVDRTFAVNQQEEPAWPLLRPRGARVGVADDPWAAAVLATSEDWLWNGNAF
jgi:hypothetical protein